MNAFAIHFAFEFRAGLRNRSPAADELPVAAGLLLPDGAGDGRDQPRLPRALVPAMVVFAALSGALLGLPDPLVTAREAGIFRTYRINGVPALSILVIPALTTVLHIAIASTLIVATAAPLFGGVLPSNWAAFVLIALLTVFTFGALGALIGVVSANSRATVLWSQLIFLPSMLLGGLMMPLSLLPPSVLVVSALLPPAQAMQAFMGLAYGQETVLNPTVCIGVLAATAVLAFGLAIYLFNWGSGQPGPGSGHPALALLVLLPGIIALFVG